MPVAKSEPVQAAKRLTSGLLAAHAGKGALLQRDYWAVIARCRESPSRVIDVLASRFAEFAPADLVAFRRAEAADRPLASGDELDVDIRWAGPCRVRVVNRDAQTITLATLTGHPEAGRITFGAYRNDYGDVVFHIRSRARSGSRKHYLGFRTAGEPMQTNAWTDFVQAVAYTFGEGIIGCVHAQTRRMGEREEPETDETLCSPTFRAEGD
jgi:hypothetical protein